ncbi:MAG: hypothetical protein ACSHYB_10715 [Roseibacillus sp.]
MRPLSICIIAPLLATASMECYSETVLDSELDTGELLSYYLDESVYRRFLEQNGIKAAVEPHWTEEASPLWSGKPESLPEWNASAEEFEDGSSGHFYFFFSNGASVERVRWIWNGGASNKPAVVDYFLRGGMLKVFCYEGARESAENLSEGRNAPLVLLKKLSFALPGSDFSDDDKQLDEDSLTHLRSLFDILAKEREPIVDGSESAK